MNPLLTEYSTPYGVPPFEQIEDKHFAPAFEYAMAEQNRLIEQLIGNKAEADFENTILAYEQSGQVLARIKSTFFNILGTNSTEERQKIAKKISPKLSAHKDDILMNTELFRRIKAVYDKKGTLDLKPEQEMLLSETYKKFKRAGVNLPEAKQKKLKKINGKLSELKLTFGENLLNEVKEYQLIIEDEEMLSGLSDYIIAAAAKKAEENSQAGKWIFTIDKPTLLPVLKTAQNRELRKKLFTAYSKKGDNGNANDNKEIINEIVNLRIKKAKLLGYDNYSDYVLDDRMAKNTDNVYQLLDKLMKPALETAKQEAEMFKQLIKKEGKDIKLKPWDWWYYAEKVRKAKYDLNEEELKPYFSLGNSLDGMFQVLEKLFGLKFNEITDLPKHHKDVKAYTLKDQDGSLLGVLYMDFFVREGKNSGAWMTSFRKQYKKDGKRIAPVISTVFNFPKPVDGKPALLSFDHVLTLYHEMGHALHGLMSDVTYRSLSGTSVARDFVELPSQILENWALQPEVIKQYAIHYETGDTISDEIINKIKKSSKFNQGFAATEYLAASYLDLSWHTLSETGSFDVNNFEAESMQKIALIDEIIPRYRSTYFSHVFRGGYAVGYYSYIWAEVLDADAFEYFKEKGIFNPDLASSFRENILEKGGSIDQAQLYEQFRGQQANADALLKRKGFL